jgi:metal-responsive CopG/Arc/MetJ family transcriptional regulator
MPARPGNTNGMADLVSLAEEPKKPVTAKVPESLIDRLHKLLKPGESRSAAIVEAIKAYVIQREGEIN